MRARLIISFFSPALRGAGAFFSKETDPARQSCRALPLQQPFPKPDKATPLLDRL